MSKTLNLKLQTIMQNIIEELGLILVLKDLPTFSYFKNSDNIDKTIPIIPNTIIAIIEEVK